MKARCFGGCGQGILGEQIVDRSIWIVVRQSGGGVSERLAGREQLRRDMNSLQQLRTGM